jgi:hypothetical protein
VNGLSPKSQLLNQKGEDMIYLIVSLVMGLIYLISGKVKYNKTIYLEGTKARIAGLIFLAPIGLTLFVIVAGLIYESLGNVSDTKAFEQTLDRLASSFVRNGLMIGLAYINFYSVSQETKQRGGCLTYWLAYTAIFALLLTFFALGSKVQWFIAASMGMTILQLIFIIGIWLWKMWGVWGYTVATVIHPIVIFFRVNSLSEVSVSLITSLNLVLVLYLLVKPKWQFFE